MCAIFLFIFTLALHGYANAQDNRTVMDNEVSNRIEEQHGIANMKYACSLTIERYIEIGQDNTTKEIKTRPALVCCPGYGRDAKGICQPYCSGGCGNGFCESPEICSCTQKNCAFNTVERRCACFEATCPKGCPANATCIADNTCDCKFGFVRKSNWTSQFTNSTSECIPYCYPFCTNKVVPLITEECVCNYTQAPDGTTFNKNETLTDFDKRNKTQEYLGHLFQSHGHPSFTAGLTGFALGAVVGNMMGSFGKSKNNYGMPGGYGTGYGMPGNTHYGGGGYPGGYNTGSNYGYGLPNSQYGGVNYGQGVPPNTNYGHGVPPNTNYGHGVPPNTNYGHGVPPNTNYGAGGTYGNTAQYPGTHYGQPAPPLPGQNTGSVYGGQSQPGTGVSRGNAGQTGGTNYGWNVPAPNAPPSDTNVVQKTANTYGSAPGQAGQSQSGSNLGSAPGQAGQSQSGSNLGSGTGQRTNYGWNVPSDTHAGGSTGNTNYGWNVPSNTNTGSNTGTAPKGTGTSSSGTSWSPWGNSNSGGSRGKGHSGGRRKSGRRH